MLSRFTASLAVLLIGPPMVAQSPAATEVELRWSPDGEAVEAAMRTDLDGLLLGLGGATDVEARIGALERLRAGGPAAVEEAVAALATLFRRRVRLRFDGEVVASVVTFPERREREGVLETLGAEVVVAASVPPRAGAVSFFASRAFRGVAVRSRLGVSPVVQELAPGERSRPFALARH